MKTVHSVMLYALVFTVCLIDIALAQPTHFVKPIGNPFSPMNIFIIGARFNGVNITSDFEIGIFDGALCVGAALFNGAVSQLNPLEVVATKDDGTGNGFTEGNPIIFKLWDMTLAQEFTLANGDIRFFDLETGAEIPPVAFSGLETAAVSVTATSSDVRMVAELPVSYELYQNFPNPFNPSTTISYALPKPARVIIEIYDVKGDLITALKDDMEDAGYHSLRWDGITSRGEKVATGVYFYTLTAGKFSKTNKMLLMK